MEDKEQGKSVSLIWNKNKDGVEVVPDINGDYIMGVDPYVKENWFARILIFFRLRKRSHGKAIVFRVQKDGTAEYIK